MFLTQLQWWPLRDEFRLENPEDLLTSIRPNSFEVSWKWKRNFVDNNWKDLCFPKRATLQPSPWFTRLKWSEQKSDLIYHWTLLLDDEQFKNHLINPFYSFNVLFKHFFRLRKFYSSQISLSEGKRRKNNFINWAKFARKTFPSTATQKTLFRNKSTSDNNFIESQFREPIKRFE